MLDLLSKLGEGVPELAKLSEDDRKVALVLATDAMVLAGAKEFMHWTDPEEAKAIAGTPTTLLVGLLKQCGVEDMASVLLPIFRAVGETSANRSFRAQAWTQSPE